ncbi:hypothetical protein TL16_g09910 [Triparma laevis f. inornata]|uniref:CWH43-like N-terminal domain-containing protein n=1 Tax=Triparma laevis f. inornata TaxID=1714386 RepID=A0A9W7B985_9STRA|nr:hypothetical protein TL16_g09910 [Triparma laevis f. inornata]
MTIASTSSSTNLDEKTWKSAPLLIFMLVLPVVTFITTYAISLSNGKQQYPYLFLSVSIESKPASCIGTFGLSLTCLLAPFLAFIRYSYIRKEIQSQLGSGHDDYEITKLWNRRNLYLAIAAGLGGHGVSSFQSTTEEGGSRALLGIHLIFATWFFAGGSSYCFVSHWLDKKLPLLGTEKERMWRKFFCYGTLAQFFTICVFFPFIVFFFGASDELIAVMSFIEITMLGTFMSTYITFIDEFKNMRYRIMVFHSDRHYSLHETDTSANLM